MFYPCKLFSALREDLLNYKIFTLFMHFQSNLTFPETRMTTAESSLHMFKNFFLEFVVPFFRGYFCISSAIFFFEISE